MSDLTKHIAAWIGSRGTHGLLEDLAFEPMLEKIIEMYEKAEVVHLTTAIRKALKDYEAWEISTNGSIGNADWLAEIFDQLEKDIEP